MNHDPTGANAELISVELCFLFDRAIDARQRRKVCLSDVFVRAAEGLIRASLPNLSQDIGMVASRKGVGDQIAPRIAQGVTPTAAGAIFVLWMFRGARQPALCVLVERFGNHPDYQDAVRLLCHRLFTAQAKSTSIPIAIEVAAPHAR